MTSTKKTPDYIGSDFNGTDVLFIPDAIAPNTRYQFHYPETKHGKVDAEDVPLQIGKPADVGVNGCGPEALLMVTIHALSKQYEKNPTPIMTAILGDLLKAHKLLKLRYEHMRKNNLTEESVNTEDSIRKEHLALKQHENRQRLKSIGLATALK